MNNYFYINSFLFLFALSSTYAQEVTSLRSLALDKTAQELHTQLIKLPLPKDRRALIRKWDKKSGGLIIPKDYSSQESVLERFEQKYFSKLKRIKNFYHRISAITNDGTKIIVDPFTNCNLLLYDLEAENENNINALTGHKGLIDHVTITPDNSKALSCSYDNTLILWDLNACQPIHTLKGHTSRVRYVTLTSDGNKAISTSDDATLILWNLSTGQPIHILNGHKDMVSHVALTSDNNKALSCSRDKTLILWDLNTGKPIHTLKGHTLLINHVALTSDNSKAVSASDDGTLIVWNLNTGQTIYTLKGHTKWINHVAITADNSKAISASNDRTLIVWDLNTGTPIYTLSDTGRVRHVAITSDQNKILSVSDERTLRIWNLSTGKLLQEYPVDINTNETIITKNLVVAGTKLFKIEDWESIIANMSKLPKKTISAPHNLLDVKQVGALTSLYQAQFEKQKIQATPATPTNSSNSDIAHRSIKQKIFTIAGYLKNKLINAYKRIS